MIDPAVKTAMAFCILIGGICAATLFRRERPPEGPISPSSEEEFLLRCRAEEEAASFAAKERERLAAVDRERQRRTRPATVVTPLDRHEPPPSLASDYPEPDRSAGLYSGATAGTTDGPQTHKIVDGDTLAALAERYLGSSARAQEIYEANRDVLHDPMLLPIGAELKIPPRGSLVPVR